MTSGSKTITSAHKVSATRMFKAMEDWENLGAKALPSMIKSGSVVSGDGSSVGSVVQINYTSSMPFSYVQERVDSIDHANLSFKTSLVQGGFLGNGLEELSLHYSFKPTGNSSCTVTLVMNYTVTSGGSIPADELNNGAKYAATAVNAAEAYLIANPGAYA